MLVPTGVLAEEVVMVLLVRPVLGIIMAAAAVYTVRIPYLGYIWEPVAEVEPGGQILMVADAIPYKVGTMLDAAVASFSSLLTIYQTAASMQMEMLVVIRTAAMADMQEGAVLAEA